LDKYSFNFEFVKAGAPIVTISSLGLAFNQLSRSRLGYPQKVNIGYDENARTIGVKPHDNSTNITSYEFESREKNGWIRIGCKDFVRYLATQTKMDFSEKAVQFIATYQDDTGILIINVDEEHVKR
jgi:hypothetical protein